MRCSGIKSDGTRCKIILKTGAIKVKVYCSHHKDQNEGHLAEAPLHTQLILTEEGTSMSDRQRRVIEARRYLEGG